MKRPTYLDAGRKMRFGKPSRRLVDEAEPAPDPSTFPDFSLGTWLVQPALGTLTRGDRIVSVNTQTMMCLLVLHTAPVQGVSRAMLVARVFGLEASEEKIRPCLSLLRRVFAEDRSVRIEHAPNYHYCLWTGPPVEGRLTPGTNAQSSPLLEPITGITQWVNRPRQRAMAISLALVLVGLFAAMLVHVLGGMGHGLNHRVTGISAFAAEPGNKTSPSFSPDGRQVVYAWAKADSADSHLYVRSITGGESRELTSGPGADRFPVWSPTAALIAFVRTADDHCELWTVSPDGSNARRVADCAPDVIGPLAFTADGRALIYPNHTASLLPSQLISVNLSTGALSGVTNPTVGMPGDSYPALSGNTRRLAFVRTRNPGVADIAMVETTAGEVTHVTQDFSELAGLLWEPDSRTLLYASSRSGPSQLWSQAADMGTPRFLLSAEGEVRQPALSADGHHLIYERTHCTHELVTTVLDPKASGGTTTGPETLGAGREPQLSPDRKTLAFISRRSGNEELWLADASGESARQLTHEKADWLATPRWSPDGAQLLITLGSHGNSVIDSINVATGLKRELITEPQASYPRFSKDGKHLYYSSITSNMRQIWRRNWPVLDQAVQITEHGGVVAEESGDGKRLYIVRADRAGLWSHDLTPGGDETLIINDLTRIDAANWYTAPNSIYFVSRRTDGTAQLARYGEDTEATRLIGDLTLLALRSGLSPAPDGEQALYTRAKACQTDLDLAQIN